MPKVTIGVPVYNGERYLSRALESIVGQIYTDYQVLISDNSSTDSSVEIAKDFARNDPRFTYVRQSLNVGPEKNFRYLIDSSNTEFFVFLAADDFWYPDFLGKNIAKLENDLSAICSVSKVVFGTNGKLLHESSGTMPLEKGHIENLKKYFSGHPNDNSRFYGVFRAPVLQKSFKKKFSFHAGDWYLMALTLLYGSHVEIDEVLMYREVAEYERYMKQLKVEKPRFFSRMFPVFPMTCAFIKLLNYRQKIKVFGPLLKLNLRMSLVYVKCSILK